jgi:hypothetical protein
LNREIKQASDVEPRIELLAIPDATAFAGLESSLRTARDPLPVPAAPPPPTPAEQLDTGCSFVRAIVMRSWPGTTAGAPLVIDVGTSAEEPLRLQVTHLGAALSRDAIESLGRSIQGALGRAVQLVDVAIPSTPLSRAGGDLRFIADVSAGVRASAAISSVNVCVVEPGPPKNPRRTDRGVQELTQAVRSVLAAHPRVTWSLGEDWLVRFATEACSNPAAGDSGANSAGLRAPRK